MSEKKKILVVDDELDILAYLVALFQDSGYDTVTAQNGVEALEKAKSEKPDLISLDMAMPEQSGVRTYRALKDDPTLKSIPIIVVTGVGEEMETYLSKMKAFGKPAGFMAKPIIPEDLVAMTRNILKA